MNNEERPYHKYPVDELCDWLEWRISDAGWEPNFLKTRFESNSNKKEYMRLFDSDLRSLAKNTVETYKQLKYKNHGRS